MTAVREREATCQCGQLRVRLSGDPQLVSSCHCLACQRRTGALFGSTSFWRKSQILSQQGERRSFSRQADSGTTLTHQFCPDCGSTVHYRADHMPDLVAVAVGNFADPNFPPPKFSVHEDRKHPWVNSPPGAERRG